MKNYSERKARLFFPCTADYNRRCLALCSLAKEQTFSGLRQINTQVTNAETQAANADSQFAAVGMQLAAQQQLTGKSQTPNGEIANIAWIVCKLHMVKSQT
ncbi:MAG: hypothetical protein IJK51_10775 [Bacteroidaceae bacterium]|nr:hypothetical protein [Bacteroidaceae bacterium]